MGQVIDIRERLMHKIRNDVYHKLDLKNNIERLPKSPKMIEEGDNRIARIKNAIERINETMRILKLEAGVQDDK